MRLYEFKCKDCGKKFEEWANRPEDIRKCPYCHSEKVERVYNSVTFKFIGPGFYETDYKNRG